MKEQTNKQNSDGDSLKTTPKNTSKGRICYTYKNTGSTYEIRQVKACVLELYYNGKFVGVEVLSSLFEHSADKQLLEREKNKESK